MNDVKYISRKGKWRATKLIKKDGVLHTEYLGFWDTKKQAKEAPPPMQFNGIRKNI